MTAERGGSPADTRVAVIEGGEVEEVNIRAFLAAK
jgi:hypothetical protein